MTVRDHGEFAPTTGAAAQVPPPSVFREAFHATVAGGRNVRDPRMLGWCFRAREKPPSTMTALPDLHVSAWSGTKRSLHLYAQILGKIRVALSPPQPNWMHTALSLNARGLTTGALPCGLASVEASLDVFAAAIAIAHSSGERRTVALAPERTVADVYADVSRALEELGVVCFITPVPQEVPDMTPLHEDRRACAWDSAAVQRWFDAYTATAMIFERWRSRFFGRSAIAVWWGAFDVATILFNGRHVPAPADRGYLMKYDLDAALMNVGLYLGDEQNAPFFYGYIYPQPEDAPELHVAPSQAAWSPQLGEWLLPYDAVRASGDPEAMVRTFVDSIYELCFSAAGWDRDAFVYRAPPARVQR